MSFTPLSTGAIERILQVNETGTPVLQVLGSKSIKGSEGPDRWRLLVSDGKHMHSYAMLASQMNHYVTTQKLTNYSIIKLMKHTVTVINATDPINKRVLIILDLNVLHLGSEVNVQLGSPVAISAANSTANAENTQPNKPAAGAATIPKPLANTGNHHQSMNSSTTMGLSDALTHPISSLSPYQNKWVIKVRVTNKSAIRTWNNAKGEGKLFSMDLLDESGEIRATAFRDQVDKYYDMIKVGKVYFISKCQLKPANKQFSTLKNDYEMTFGNETLVQECDESDGGGIPTIQYDFATIASVANMEANAILDVAGICIETGEVQQFTARSSGKELKKREIVIADQSRASVSLTLWGDEAEKFSGAHQPVIVIKGARVSEFGGGKSLGVTSGGMMQINPNIPEGLKLRAWFDNGGANQVTENVSAKAGGAGAGIRTEWLTMYEAKERKLGFGDKPDYFQIMGNIHLIKTANAVYQACPQPECQKKVIDQGNGMYRCEKCNNEYPNFKYRMLLNIVAGDWSGSDWTTCFTEAAEKILGRTSQEIGLLLENKESEDNFFPKAHFTSHIFKLRVKNEHYGDTSRTRISTVSATPIVYKQYNQYLVNNLKRMTGISTTA